MKTHFSANRALKKLDAVNSRIKKSAPDLLEQAARLGAISCATSTQPFGNGEFAKSTGEKAVAADINKVYATPGLAFEAIAQTNPKQAKAFWAAMDRGDLAKARGILRKAGGNLKGIAFDRFDGGVLHAQAQNKRTGRVSQRHPVMIVTNPAALKTYKRRKQAMVGFGKGAWAAMARELGGVRGLRGAGAGGSADITASWILRHSRGAAPWRISRNYRNNKNPRITLTSMVRYADNILPEKARRDAERIAIERLLKSLQIAAAYEARQATRGL